MKKSILLVEDDPVVRDIIKSALEKEYIVLEAKDYSEVTELLHCPIDLAIIDYILPDRDGFDVLKTLRETKPALPAIIMTGYSHERVVIRALRSEVADYIKKPLKLSYLRKRLSELFGNEKGYEDYEELESKEEFILDAIVEYIEDNYSKNLTLDKLASMACMNRFKFSKVFRKRFKQTFTSYLNSIRVKNAAELLRNPGINITEIAKVVGYSSATHFERVFKAVYGMTPSQYRKKERF